MLRFRLVACCSGAAVMMAEMTAARAIAPYFGSSIVVWTNVIGIVLVALAFGYWAGGRIAEARPDPRVLGGIIATAGALLLIPAFAVQVVGSTLLRAVLASGNGFAAIATGSFIAVALLFALPMALLGMVAPYLVQLAVTPRDAVGRTAGSLYALSTLGSLVGTFLPALVLLPLIGMRRTLLVAAVLLLLTSALLLPRPRRVVAGAALIMAVVFAVGSDGAPWVFGGTVVAAAESRYQYLRIVDRPARDSSSHPERLLLFNEGFGVQSMAVRDDGVPNGYFTTAASLPALFPPARPLRILVLGNAGGTIGNLMQRYFPDRALDITGVELDPMVTALAREYFPPPPQPYPIVHADSRVFVRQSDAAYDVIVVDAYTDQLTIPAHLVTREFFALLSERLAPEGVLALNVNAPRDDSRLLVALLQAVRSEFPDVRVAHVAAWNRIVLAGTSLPPIAREYESVLPARIAEEFTAFTRALQPVQHDPAVRPFTDDWAPIELYTDLEVFQGYAKRGG
ncbi:MAG: fused MFS/spermidine synthase [bacterium]|nr:fused MFS/spermidine synthase [bacterium]